MNGNGHPTVTDALRALEHAVTARSLTELPALLGAVEQIKAAGWMRIYTGLQQGHGTDELLTVPQVATRLKLSPYRTYELCRQGTLKRIRVGKSVRVRPEDLAAYIAEQRTGLLSNNGD